MLIQRATLLDGTRADIRVADRIVDIGENITPRRGEAVVDAAGGTVIPGLHDHHVHLRSAAAALTSVRVGPDAVQGRAGLARALAGAPVDSAGWIRAVDYHESIAGPLTRTVLDDIASHTPVRVQHRSGVLWTLNSAGLARIGMSGHPDGTLRSDDPAWSDRLPHNAIRLDEVSRRLSAVGVTSVTDATPDLEPGEIADLVEAHQRGEVRQRVHCLAPGKKILHDTDLNLDGLATWIAARHAGDTPVAVHCVTAAQLVVTLAALRSAGTHPRDRIEHAAVIPDDTIDQIARLGVTVVTQPNFVAERGDQYLDDIPAAEHHELWRVATLQQAGVKVALSTDMPFGNGDPWRAMRAAVERTTRSGAVLGARECVTPRTALEMFCGSADDPSTPRLVTVGQPGDVCILAASPADAVRTFDANMVAATIVAGEIVHHR